jgi:hypothetical protein
VLHRTYDSWKSTNVDDEFLGPEPEDDELPEPTVEEMWSGSRGEYVHVVTFANGSQFTITRETAGAYVGDYTINGPGGFYADGYPSPEKAINYLIDMVMS